MFKGLCYKNSKDFKLYKEKKRFTYQEQDPIKLEEYRQKLAEIPIEKRYFLDECGINKTPIREFGYSSKNVKIQDKKTGKRHSNTTIISFCNKTTVDEKYRLVAPHYQKTPMNTEHFLGYLTIALPKIPVGSYLIMDNVAFHKSNKILDYIKEKGYFVLFLSAYSPQENPIEHLWFHLKYNILKLASTCLNFYEKIIKTFELIG